MDRRCIKAASLFGFTGVALGAFGAHLLKEKLGSNRQIWETGVQYQMVHALALLFAGLAAPFFSSAWVVRIGLLFSAGMVIFSGSLYVLALTDTKWLGAITPLGGLCLLAGWACVFIAAAQRQPGDGGGARAIE